MLLATQRLPRLATASVVDTTHNLIYGLQQKSSIHSTSILCTKRAGRHKPSMNRDQPLTYEQSFKPDMIGVRKGWNSFNTSAMIEGIRKAETAQEDIFIRKFVAGAWPKLLCSEVIIKRRANLIILTFMCLRYIAPGKLHFLIGFTEEILSNYLKSIVKLEIQTIEDVGDLTYKYV